MAETRKSKPIIMSAESVRAILDGRKTQTRRVMMPQPELVGGIWQWKDGMAWTNGYPRCPVGNMEIPIDHAPYQVGDVLWVRESFSENDLAMTSEGFIKFRADGGDFGPWKSPILMPRWASRLSLVVTAVRAERVQEISYENCRAEGCTVPCERYLGEPNNESWFAVQAWYRKTWDALNARRGHPWSSNPWVFAYTFSRVEHSEYPHGGSK